MSSSAFNHLRHLFRDSEERRGILWYKSTYSLNSLKTPGFYINISMYQWQENNNSLALLNFILYSMYFLLYYISIKAFSKTEFEAC